MGGPCILILIVTISVAAESQPSSRIATAGSAITEIVCALGDCDKIVASDQTSLYPEHIQSLPSIGYRTGISAEGIISLNPTLVIVEKDYVDDVVLTQFKSAQIQVVSIPSEYDFEGTKRAITTVASSLSRSAEGERQIKKIEGELAEAKAWQSKSKLTPTVLCVHNRGTAMVNLAGKATFSEILKYAGARNVVTNTSGFKSLNAEALIAFNPDYILFFESGWKVLEASLQRLSNILFRKKIIVYHHF